LGHYDYDEFEPAPVSRDKTQTKMLDDWYIYEGELSNDQRCGRGARLILKHKLKYYVGQLYEGYWKDDKLDGHGRLIWSDGDHYIGNWKKNREHG